MPRAASITEIGTETGGSDVTGGGPAGDAAAVARIDAQFPVVPGDTMLTGSDALSYIDRLVSVIPALGVLSNLTKVGNCATKPETTAR